MDQVQRPFDPNHPKYISYCGCHVMTVTKILASLSTASIILYVIALIAIIAMSGSIYRYFEEWQIFLFGCFVLLSIALNVSLWYGLIKEREGYLIPALVVMAIVLVLESIGGLIKIGASVMVEYQKHSHMGTTLMILGIAVYLALLAPQYWFFSIIKSTYNYIKDKRAAAGGIVLVQHMDHVYVSVPKDDPAPPLYNDCVNVR